MKLYNPTEIAALVSRVAGVTEDVGARVEVELRRSYGGRRITIPQEPAVSVQADRIDELLRQRMTVREIAPRLGVSRSTIYRRLRSSMEEKRAKKGA